MERWYGVAVSSIAVVVNAIVVRSVCAANISLSGYKGCLISLGCSNFFLALVNLSEMVSFFTNKFCFSFIRRSFQMCGLLVNLFDLSAMSFDHYIVIVYPYVYNRMMARSHVTLVIVLYWILGFSIGTNELVITTIRYFQQNFMAKPQQVVNCSSSSWFHDYSQDEYPTQLLTTVDPKLETSFPTLNIGDIGGAGDKNKTKHDWMSQEGHEVTNDEIDMEDDMLKPLGYDCFLMSMMNSIESVAPESWCQIYSSAMIGHYLEYIVMASTAAGICFVTFCYCQIFREVSAF